MAEPYLSRLQDLIAACAPDLRGDAEIACRHFFSGAAAYCNGVMFMSQSPAGLALKLPERERTALLAEGGKPLRYFPNAPVKRDYVVLPAAVSDDVGKLRAYMQKSLSGL